MRLLRFNTAQRVTVGPFIDVADFKTPEVALTVTAEKLTLIVDEGGVPTLVLDAAPTASGGANDMVHIAGDDAGYYDLELAAADVNHLGRAQLSLNDLATHLPVFHEFMIVPQVIYDALVAGTGVLPANMTQYLGAAVPAGAGPTGIATGTAQTGAGDGSSITLAAGTTAIAGRKGNMLFAYGGTGAGQVGVIAHPGMDNTSKIAPFVNNVVTPFDNTTTYVIFPGDPAPSVADIQSGLATSTEVGAVDDYIDTEIGSIITDLTTVLSRLSTARAGYLDNLNVGGLVASSAEVTAIQNNTRVVRVVPDVIERPDAGTVEYRVELYLYDENGNMEAPDSAPTIALVNQAGTDRSSRLDSATMALIETGRYRAIYTASVGDTLEQLVWTFSVVEGGATRKYGNNSLIVDTSAVDFTGADRTLLQALTPASIADAVHDEVITTGHAVAGSAAVVINNLAGESNTLVGRLTATRAGKLDALSEARLAELDAANLPADVDALVASGARPSVGQQWPR